MKNYDVYGTKNGLDDNIYCEAVNELLGENKTITTDTGVFLASVRPLLIHPELIGLIKIGTLKV